MGVAKDLLRRYFTRFIWGRARFWRAAHFRSAATTPPRRAATGLKLTVTQASFCTHWKLFISTGVAVWCAALAVISSATSPAGRCHAPLSLVLSNFSSRRKMYWRARLVLPRPPALILYQIVSRLMLIIAWLPLLILADNACSLASNVAADFWLDNEKLLHWGRLTLGCHISHRRSRADIWETLLYLPSDCCYTYSWLLYIYIHAFIYFIWELLFLFILMLRRFSAASHMLSLLLGLPYAGLRHGGATIHITLTRHW